MATKKLIEVALPLEKINEAAIREKSIRHGHPSSLHLWWARRPLAATRAVIWSSLVDDPSSHPELFPTEEDQRIERERLFTILDDLVVWENSNNEEVLKRAKKEILKYNAEGFPTLLDPFAGGGAIPLEAQRLGLKPIAHDLNPVAVMINKAMIEFPSRFAGLPPVNPDSRTSHINNGWVRAQGLAEDVRYYGEWMRKEAFKQIGYLYPKVKIPSEQGGGEATVIAWIWARTAKCSNPACSCSMPLASKFVLSRKKNKEAWIEPKWNGEKFNFIIHKGICPPTKETLKQGKGANFKCPLCGAISTDEYIKQQGKDHKIGNQLIAIVAEGKHGRLYISPSVEQELAAKVAKPDNCPEGKLPDNPRWFSPPAFGMTSYEELFTNRQLTALTTLSRLALEVQRIAEKDAIDAGFDNNHIALSNGGTGARAYGEAVSIYLEFIVEQLTNHCSTLCGWHANNEQLMNTFGRQALPMVWDYAEVNVFSNSTGSFRNLLERQTEGLESLGFGPAGEAEQYDAQSDCGIRNVMVSTDPPYYDNIGYADLSDYFYVWMRLNLKNYYPKLFETLLVPKTEELVATPYHFEGSQQRAKAFFEEGMLSACEQIYKYADNDIPVTIYYAYKQNDVADSDGNASTGWETMLSSIIEAGFSVSGTWPIRTEQTAALKSHINSLASSVVLVCRKRSINAAQTTRRNLVAELRRELRPALKKLQESNIAPVDLAQAAIGPGMSVFSRYRRVLEADGTPMTVRSAQKIINEEVDMYFNEKVGNLDLASRFCVDLYTQSAYNDIKYGDAEILANAKGASIPKMVSRGILYAKAGNVHLVERKDLPEKTVADEDNIWMLTQQLTHAMEKGGVEACANIIAPMFGSNAEDAKDLAYRLYTIAEQKKWTNEAFAYNALVVAWPDIQSKAAELKAAVPKQMSIFDYEFDGNNK